MADKLPARRSIKGTMPTGNYAAGTKNQLQGKASNKTQQYLAGLDPADPGQQAFYRAALTDIPHPLAPGQHLTYGELQQALQGSQRGAMLDAYAAQSRLPKAPTAAEYQQAMFDQAHARLLERGAAKPGEYAFPRSADEARRVPATATAVAHGNYLSPDAAGQVTNSAMQEQRFGDVPTGQGAYVAPGMAQQVAPLPVAARRVIRGSAPGTIASN